MDEWHVGDPEDWGDSVGVPDIPYMGYLNDDDDGEDPQRPPENNTSKSKADILGEEAWKLYNEFKDEEALVLINQALPYDQHHSNNWNRKGIILESLKRYEESKECYDRSISLRRDPVVIDNKARMIKDWCWDIYSKCKDKDFRLATELLEEAIRDMSTIQSVEDVKTYRNLLETLEFRRDYYKMCRSQYESLMFIPKEELITIAGTKFYSCPKFEKGMMFQLKKEPENEHDPDAIAVYYDGDKIGYVANSDMTSCDLTSKASDLKDIPDIAFAEYVMNYELSRHIARIIENDYF